MSKLAISNIGWAEENDATVYDLMKKYGFRGLEIAPTRIFSERPYDMNSEAEAWSKKLKSEYGFCIPSMQSIWYGRQVDSKGFLLNLDLGTMIQNEEDVRELTGKVRLINHVHISEPGLKPIVERPIHSELKVLLTKEGYDRFISIEMGKVEDINILEEKMAYVRRIFA